MLKKRIRWTIVCFIVLLLVSPLLAFGGTGGDKDERETVVLLMIGMQSPYCPPYVSNLTNLLNQAGIGMFMFDAKFDAQLQASQMDDAIAMNPAAIILFAADSQAMAGGIKKAHDAGIPVIMSNNKPVPESEPYTVMYVGPDYYSQAQLAGEMINDHLGGKGKIVIIEGLAGQEAQINRTKGLVDKFDELNADIEILAKQTAGWRKDLAVQVMQDFITRYGDEIDAVYAQDDTMGIGAAIAMEEAGYAPGTIPIFGIGGSREGLKAINDGIMFGTVMQSPIVETDGLVPYVIQVLENGMEAADKWDPYWNFMDMPKVTKDNVEQYLPGDW
jgi:ribose transport system substrate-binding protein